MENAHTSSNQSLGKDPSQTNAYSDVPDRDRLIGAMFDAATNPLAYRPFVAAMSEYLENSVVKAWNIHDLSEIDIGTIESDHGLAVHFAKLNQMLADSPHRVPPGSLRERISDQDGIAILIDQHGKIVGSSRNVRTVFKGTVSSPDDIAEYFFADDANSLRDAVTDHVIHKREITPLILRGEDFHLVVRTLRCDIDREDFLCLETLAVEWSSNLEAILKNSFHLTPAEIRVVQGLVAGRAVKDISIRFKRSEGTIRNQVKSILAKTGAGGIANLNRIIALISENTGGAPAVHPLCSETFPKLDIHTLPDGRALEVRLQGPEDGKPILFIHGMLFGSELPKPALDCLEQLGLRLIAPARPNFGMSSPPPGAPENEPDRLVEDLTFVLDHYNVDRTVCLTNIAGTVYGYALAASLPERISGLVNVASSLPVLKAKHLVAMPPTQRLLAFLMRFLPGFLPPLFQSGIAQARASEEMPFLEALYSKGTLDLAVIQRPELADLLVRSVHFATDQGYLGAYTDTAQIVRDWTGYVDRTDALGIPSIHLHGIQDPQYMIDDVAEFADRYHSLQLCRVDGAGQLLLFDRPDLALAAVDELVG